MKKTKPAIDLHEKIQETVDGSRLIRAGILNKDPEILEAGWKRVVRVRGGQFAKKIFDTLKKDSEQGSSAENKG